MVFSKLSKGCSRTFWVLATLCALPLAGQMQPARPPTIGQPAHPLRKQLGEIEREISSVKEISQAVLSPDGLHLAYAVADPASGTESLFLASPTLGSSLRRITLPGAPSACRFEEPAWAPRSTQLAFLSDCAGSGQMQMQLFVLDVAGPSAAPRQLTNLLGHVASPKWSPDGTTIAFLFVDHATRAPNPMAPGDPQTGVIDDLQQQEAQRIAFTGIATGQTRMFSPATLNVFEFDWSPDSHALTYTAAPPPGDDNWYIAKLYTEDVGQADAHAIYEPDLQIALPRWSPDGKQIAFIAGLMSDEGATGGEIYSIDSGGGTPRDLTPGRSSSPAWFRWSSPDSLLFAEFVGGSTALSTLSLHDGKTALLWQGGESVHAVQDDSSLSVADTAPMQTALVRESWTMAPEVWAGSIGHWVQVSHVNERAKPVADKVESISWQSDTYHEQGWLLFPSSYDPKKKYPMLVSVHGGPAWIRTPTFAAIDFNVSSFVHLGYFIFLPNPRGSFGEGEAFTQANRRDWGFGDLRDTVAGVDSVLAKYPVDQSRVGMIGWSYGASTAMMAAGRTDRFRALVAGAGACNLVSYYGQNQIDKWMLPYFGASIYDDAAAYMRSSALTYVKQVKAPVLLLVGERDEEAPPPQSFEFWHALKELHVPTELVIYSGEGHDFYKDEDRVDLMQRAAEWFARYMPPSQETGGGK